MNKIIIKRVCVGGGVSSASGSENVISYMLSLNFCIRKQLYKTRFRINHPVVCYISTFCRKFS
jgi:hypothetical protein